MLIDRLETVFWLMIVLTCLGAQTGVTAFSLPLYVLRLDLGIVFHALRLLMATPLLERIRVEPLRKPKQIFLRDLTGGSATWTESADGLFAIYEALVRTSQMKGTVICRKVIKASNKAAFKAAKSNFC